MKSSKSISAGLTRTWERPETEEELDRESAVLASYIDSIFADDDALKLAGYIPIIQNAGVTSMYEPDAFDMPTPPSTPEPGSSRADSVAVALVNAFRDGVLFAFFMNILHPGSVDPLSFLDRDIRATLSTGVKSTKVSQFMNRVVQRKTFENASGGASHKYFKQLSNLSSILVKISISPFKLIPSSHPVTAQEIMDGNQDIVMDLIWRFARGHLLMDLSLDVHPELIRVAGGRASELLRDNDEQVLLKWVNYHLAQAGSRRSVSNLSVDFCDSAAYVILMSEIAPDVCDEGLLQAVLDLDLPQGTHVLNEDEGRCVRIQRASYVLENAKLLLGQDYNISPEDLADGNPRMHLVLVGCLFTNYVGIPLLPGAGDVEIYKKEIEELENQVRTLSLEVERSKAVLEAQKLQLKDQMVSAEFEIRKRAMAKEFQLYNQIEDMQKAMEAEKEHSVASQRRIWDHVATKEQDLVEDFSRTLNLLQAYKERRKEIFEDANEYTISAFNNQGKRIVFKIPAPQLKQKCSFEFKSDRGSGRPRRLPPTPLDDPDVEQIAELSASIGLEEHLPHSQDSMDASTCTEIASAQQSTHCHTPQASRVSKLLTFLGQQPDGFMHPGAIYGSIRSVSAPPDVLLDTVDGTEAEYEHIDLSVSKRDLAQQSDLATRGSSLPQRNKGTPPRHFQKDVIFEKEAESSFVELEKTASTIHRSVQGLMEENMQQIQQIQLLAARVDEMSWLNSVMGKKVREFSEDLIKKKK